MEQVSIIIPAFNEEKSIKEVIQKIQNTLSSLNIEYEIIVIDDCSADNTLKRVEELKDIKVIRHSKNSGYGAALKTGIKNSKYETLIITDADGTYPDNIIPSLIEHSNNHDMVVGARTGEDVNIAFIRKPAKWFLNKLANYLVQEKIPDLNSGLRLLKKQIVKNYLGILPSGFSFTTTITLAMHSDGYNIKYIPINYYKRTGKSKIRPIRDTLNFVQLIIRTILLFNPLRVFNPISFSLFLLAVVKITYDILKYNFHISGSSIVILIVAFQTFLLGYLADLIVTTRKK